MLVDLLSILYFDTPYYPLLSFRVTNLIVDPYQLVEVDRVELS